MATAGSAAPLSGGGSSSSTGASDSGLLSPMRAAFAPGGGQGPESDPALEPSEAGGHTLLQRRLALYGKVLVAQSILYWLVYAVIWGPTVGFARSLGRIVSWDVFLLTGIYSAYWLVARGRPRSAIVLLATDVASRPRHSLPTAWCSAHRSTSLPRR